MRNSPLLQTLLESRLSRHVGFTRPGRVIATQQTDALGHEETHALRQQKCSITSSAVSEERLQNRQPERLGRFEIDRELEYLSGSHPANRRGWRHGLFYST